MVKPLQNINISTNSGFKFLSELSSPPGVQEAVMGAGWPGSPSPGPWNSSRSSTTAGVLALDDDARCPMPDARCFSDSCCCFWCCCSQGGEQDGKGLNLESTLRLEILQRTRDRRSHHIQPNSLQSKFFFFFFFLQSKFLVLKFSQRTCLVVMGLRHHAFSAV